MFNPSLRSHSPRLVTLKMLLLITLIIAAYSSILPIFAGSNEALASDWPSPRNNPAQTSYKDEVVMLPLNLSWKQGQFFEYDEGKTKPIIVGNTLFIGINDTYPPANFSVQALNGTTGVTIWHFEPPNEGNIGNLEAANGMIYFTTSAGKLHALDQATGTQRWQLNLEAAYTAAATVDSQRLYLVNNNKLFVIDAVNGNIVRNVTLPGAGDPSLNVYSKIIMLMYRLSVIMSLA